MAWIKTSYLAAALALLLAGCAVQPAVVALPDSPYVPASTAARAGDLLQANIELVSLRPWSSMSVNQVRTTTYNYGAVISTPAGGEIYGPHLKAALLAELGGIFQTATATDFVSSQALSQDKPDFFALPTILFSSVPSTYGQPIASRATLMVAILSRANKKIVGIYSASEPANIPFGDSEGKLQAVQNVVDALTHDIGRTIASNDQLRSMVSLGLYQDFSQQVAVGTNSPYDAEMNAVVRIERPTVSTTGTNGTSVGSGFLITKTGLLLTAAHVVGNQTNVTVKTRQNITYPGKVLALDNSRDLALVKITSPLNDFATLKLAPGVPLTGTDAIAIGAPLGLSWSLTKGIVSGIRQLRVAQVAQFDTPIDPGNSGGPLIDSDSKQVIGVISFVDANIGFAILADEAQKAFGAQIPR